MTIDASARRARILCSKGPAKTSRRMIHRAAVLLAIPLFVVGGWDSAPSEQASSGAARGEFVQAAARTQSFQLEVAQENRILALDPERISEADVRTTLALVTAPRIVLVPGVLACTWSWSPSPDFSSAWDIRRRRFAIRMTAPTRRIRMAAASGLPASWPGTMNTTRCGRC